MSSVIVAQLIYQRTDRNSQFVEELIKENRETKKDFEEFRDHVGEFMNDFALKTKANVRYKFTRSLSSINQEFSSLISPTLLKTTWFAD